MLLDSSVSASNPGESDLVLPSPNPQHRTIRPIGVYALQGVAYANDTLVTLDSVRGYLLEIDWATDNTTILNPYRVADFIDAVGLSIWEDTVWFVKEHNVYWCSTTDFIPQLFVTLPYPANGVAVWRSTIYVTCQKSGSIFVYERESARLITRFYAPGVGEENLTVREEELWVSDRLEQTVYCIDRATGEIRFSILTPFSSPSGLAFRPDPTTGEDILYVSYAGEEPYIRDDPNNIEDPYQLTFRDRTFIHPLHFHYYEGDRYTTSNGYLIEMSYVEEISPLEEVPLTHLEWRVALPTETPRQKVRQVDWIGVPFTEEIKDGQRVACFRFDTLAAHEGRIFGWKALLEVRGIKYQFTPQQLEAIPDLPPEFQTRYLVDDDDLAMDTPVILEAAREAKGTETNLLRKMLKIRNYVYDRLSYGIKPHIDTPDVALERGVGSCGEYVGVLLALARLNGIACRTVGRYKCPPHAEQQGFPLQPDFNHVWIEFYIPDYGWVPMESNVDDVIERGPYPTRFFMGLPWYHAEIGKGISFETIKAEDLPEDVSIGDLAINHVRFTILQELPPPTASRR
ncbi:transglutaminase [Oculatella sp. LEGE 06141]|uniref:transglutaminase domain-containing protein n=1 Tax=Oculatella sp. LEGE 06141 TaxID=1828648 RepID=UPI00187E26E0|nr:transglutaminase domain-containing protein [Oculatella sp. LEGE 06141]MBE9177843.1 transglutaminase [Oculatella sp. LEGE 06141]